MTITNLLTHMVVLTTGDGFTTNSTGMRASAPHGDIPTNTPAFQAYAFHTMLTNAQAFARPLGLDPLRMASNTVTYADLRPRPAGFTGSMMFDGRYNFGAMDGFFGGYTDRQYYEGMLYPGRAGKSSRAIYEEWLAATNLLTTAKARELATQVVAAAGLFGGKHGFTGNPEVLREPDKEHELAYYVFEWKNETSYTRFSVEVSGITGTVVHFSMYGPFLRLYRPPDYLELLGLSTNTVFVTKNRVPPGQPQTYEIYGSNLPTPLVEWK